MQNATSGGIEGASTLGGKLEAVLSHPVVLGFRSLFYAVTPGESSFREPKDVPDYVAGATPFFLVLIFLEVVVLHLRGLKKRMPRFNDSVSSIGAGLVSQLPALLMRNVEMSSYQWVHEHWCLYTLPWDSAWTWWLCMLGVDLGYYWVHRCAHEINFMWAGHQTHHSSQDYNLSTALRQGVFQKYSSWIFYLPLALFVPPTIFIAHIQFNLLYQFWIHTEAIDRLGPLEYVLNTPSHHRVHHGVNRYCIDRNYAGVLIIWDRMFGTFTPEQRNDEVVYGIVHQLNSWDPVHTQVHHWRYILRTLWSTEGIYKKLQFMLNGPGWQEGKPRLGLLEDIPDAHAPAVKYNPSVHGRLLHAYTVLQFLLTLVLYETVMKHRASLNALSLLLVVLFIIWTLSNVGLFYDNRPQATLSEFLRCTVIIVADNYLFASRQMAPIVVPALRYAAFLGVLACTMRLASERIATVESHRKSD